MSHKIILTRRWPEAVEQRLSEHFDVATNLEDVPFSREQFQHALANYDAVLPTVTDKLDASVFESLQPGDIRARIIGNYGVGFSHIDIASAQGLGVTVTNTPDVLSECTADIAIMLMLMAARRAGEGEREVRGSAWTGWRPTHMIGQKVSGRTLGIVGFGRIGRATAARALGFGMNIIVQNRSAIDAEVLAEYNATQVDSIETLMGQADFVSLHCPGGATNTGLINAERLALMKPTAFVINTARGEVVDEPALIDAIRDQRIAGAGLDVYCNEPAINPSLLELENVVLLPHLGSASATTRDDMGYRVLDNLLAFFNGSTPPDKVA